MTKRKADDEEKKRKKKEYDRLRRLKMKKDPVLAAEQKKKEHLKYKRKIEKKQVKLVKDMTPRERRVHRKLWREKFKKWYHQNKPVSDSLAPSMPLASSSTMQTPSNESNRARQIALIAKRRVRRNHYKVMTTNKKLEEEIKIIRRGVEEGERCPKATARAKQEAAVTLAGVAVASSCQIILPVFGALFCIVGMVLTIASYRGQEADELPEQYADRVSLTSNLRILGPVCLAIGVGMVAAGVALIYIARRNKFNNITFHCPIHGDFYPISASHSHLLNKRKMSSLGIFGPLDTDMLPTPQCPHSNRSSVSTGPPAQLTPMPPVVTSSGYLTASNLLQFGDSGGSTQSLALSYDVASFPHSRSTSPFPDHPENERVQVVRASTAT